MRRRFLFLAAFAAAPLYAGSAGGTGASFLKMGVGARGLAMGEAYTAEAGSVESLYWNPAGLVNAWRPALMFSYKPIVENTAQSQAAFSLKKNDMGFGLGYDGVQYDKVPSYDDGGNALPQYQASDQLFTAGVAKGTDRLSVGVSAKYIRSTIASVSADAWAADAGLLFIDPYSPLLSHALVVKNMGPGIKFYQQSDPLPLTAIFGNSLKLAGRVTITADVSWLQQQGAVGAAGFEWMAVGDRFHGFALRGGYTNARNKIDGLSGVSMGAGFGFGSLMIDYAWIPYGELGNSQAITLLWNVPALKLPFKKK